MSKYDDEDLIDYINQEIREAKDQSSWWRENEVKEGFSFEAGWQWSEDDEAYLNEQGRPLITFNRVAPILDKIVGLAIENRREVRFLPRGENDGYLNDLLNQAASWIFDEGDVEVYESSSYRDMLICGLGCVSTYMDYAENPDGMLKFQRVFPLEMLWDTTATDKNLRNTRWRCRQMRMTKLEVIDVFGEDVLEDLARYGSSGKDAEGIPTQNADQDYFEGQTNASGFGRSDRNGADYLVNEFQWWEMEDYYRIQNPLFDESLPDYMKQPSLDPQTGQPSPSPLQMMMEKAAEEFGFSIENAIISLWPEQADMFAEVLEGLMGYEVIRSKGKRKKYYKAFTSNNTLLARSENEIQDFTYQFITGKWDENQACWYGIMRAMKDPQRYANKSFSQLLHVINSNPKGGLLVEKGSVDSIEMLEEQYAAGDSVIEVGEGSITQGKIQNKAQAQLPTGFEQVLQISAQGISDTTGLAPEALGLSNAVVSSQLGQDRAAAGMVGMNVFKEPFSLYQKDQARNVINYIRLMAENYNGRLIRVVGNEYGQYVPLLKEDLAEEYDVVLSEAPATPSQRMRIFEELVSLLNTVGDTMTMALLPLILEFAPVDQSIMDKIKGLVEQSNQPDPVNQALTQAQLKLIEAQAAEAASRVPENGADVILKKAKAVESMAKARKAGTDATIAKLNTMFPDNNGPQFQQRQ